MVAKFVHGAMAVAVASAAYLGAGMVNAGELKLAHFMSPNIPWIVSLCGPGPRKSARCRAAASR